MEKLPSDMKMELAKNLKGEDILNLCKTSKEMNKICSSDRYNPLWKNKLKEEFDIHYRGKDSYNRYIRENELYQRDFYELTMNFDGDIQNYLFTTKEKAIDYAIEIFLEEENNEKTYYEILEILEDDDKYENYDEDLSCEIKIISLMKNEKSTLREKYNKRKNKIREKFGEPYISNFLSLIYKVEERLDRYNEDIDTAFLDLMRDYLPDEYLFDGPFIDEESFDNDTFRSTKDFLKTLI
jgi:hypothetical protein